jgi:hypothetical protein
VFCAVRAVITVMPNPPRAEMVLRSAWIPAPPPESDPATVSTLIAFIASAPSPEFSPGKRIEDVFDEISDRSTVKVGDFPDTGQKKGTAW